MDHLKFNYLPSQHFVQQDSECPPIHGLPIGLISNDLENTRHPVRQAHSSRSWKLSSHCFCSKSALAWGGEKRESSKTCAPPTVKGYSSCLHPRAGQRLKEQTGRPVST